MDMDSKSLVENIITDISSDGRRDVFVNDEALTSKMLRGNEDQEEDSPRWNGFTWSIDWNTPFPIIRASLHFIWSCFMGLIFACYHLFENLTFRLTGKKKNYRRSIRANSIILTSGIMITVASIIVMIVFFLKDILLFPSDNHINHYGTITMAQPCGVEHNVVLMGSSECWAETGIRVVKGDKVSIAASGAFYGKVSDYHDKAKANESLMYGIDVLHWKKKDFSDKVIGACDRFRSRFGIGERDSTVTDLCVYNGYDARFGSLLYQIKPETEKPSYSNRSLKRNQRTIWQVEPRRRGPHTFKARRSGELCFAVNDIYIRDTSLFDMAYEFDLKDASTQLFSKDAMKKMEDPQCYKNFRNSVVTKNKAMWYDDNLGEILLNVNVERKHPGNLLSFLTKPFRWIFHNNGWLWILSLTLIVMSADLAFGIRMKRKLAGKQN